MRPYLAILTKRRLKHKRSDAMRVMPSSARWRCAVWLILLVAASASPASAQLRRGSAPNRIPRCEVRSQDEIWVVCTRHLDFSTCACQSGPPEFSYYRYDCHRGWILSSRREFFQGNGRDSLTSVYVHGNRIDHDWALDHGLAIYCRLICSAPPRPIRHVIWSWSADALPCNARIIKDVRVKADRTVANAYYLACWLNQLSPNQQVGLAGFSYGGRSILGSLHLLAGGQLGCCRLGGNGANRVRPRVAVWGVASEASWLCRGGAQSLSVSQMDRGLCIYNPLDPALKRYQRFLPNAEGPALGSVGLPGCVCNHPKLFQINAARTIGKVHRFQPYADSECLMSHVRRYVLWMDAHSVPTDDYSVPMMPMEVDESAIPVGALEPFDLGENLEAEIPSNGYVQNDPCHVPVGKLPEYVMGLSQLTQSASHPLPVPPIVEQTADSTTDSTELR